MLRALEALDGQLDRCLGACKDTIPLFDPWTPPQWVPRGDTGCFELATHTRCYQRGYVPEAMWDSYVQIVDACFRHNSYPTTRARLDQSTYDFLIAITPDRQTAIAGCMVQFRSAPGHTPYLYIMSLGTTERCRRKGLAQQMVHAVYTLGTLMIEKGQRSDVYPVPDRRLYIALGVSLEQPRAEHDRIERIYSRCGLAPCERTRRILDFPAFAPYQRAEDWLLISGTYCTPMYAEVQPDVLYEDERVCIYRPTAADQPTMYHQFPADRRQAVLQHGIVPARHADLYPAGSDLYAPEAIVFTAAAPGEFRIKARAKTAETVILRIAVPHWFADQRVLTAALCARPRIGWARPCPQ